MGDVFPGYPPYSGMKHHTNAKVAVDVKCLLLESQDRDQDGNYEVGGARTSLLICLEANATGPRLRLSWIKQDEVDHPASLFWPLERAIILW